VTEDDVRDFRERMKLITMRLGVSSEQAEVIQLRLEARLEGYTHAEAVAMYPNHDEEQS